MVSISGAFLFSHKFESKDSQLATSIVVKEFLKYNVSEWVALFYLKLIVSISAIVRDVIFLRREYKTVNEHFCSPKYKTFVFCSS